VVYKLPVFQEFSSKRTIRFDMILSATMGILTTILLLKSEALDMGTSISHQLSEWSYPLANGANIVNVILVDFRALDTLGEIVVLSIAAVGVWALIDSQRQKPTKK
jgi:multicomponent Na+:H+ antiporter subunit A